MKKIITTTFLVIALLISKDIYAQDYSDYFDSIALAEMKILDSSYVDALKIYKNTFDKYEFIFPKDAYIAAQVSVFIKNEKSCLDFLVLGIKNGLPTENIIYNPHLARWSTKPIAGILTTNYLDSLANYNTVRINKAFRDTIISMIKEDQKLRDKNETFLNAMIFNHKLRPKLYKKWMAQAEEQSYAILELTKKHGFPSHKTIGTSRKSDFDKFGTSFTSEYATIKLFHYDFAYQILESELPAQLKLGNISPKQFALLRDFATRHYMFGKVEDTLYQDYKYFSRWKDNKTKLNRKDTDVRLKWIQDNLNQINDERRKIGLIPYEYQNKMLLNQRMYNQNYEQLKTVDLPYFDFNYFGWE